jgi:two-component system C4-dicarboxylate transport sensor histidine kinase DctB
LKKFNFLLLNRIGIGGRLLLAFILISSISLAVSFLSTKTYLQLSENLLLLKQQDIPGLDAAARLNDKSRLIAIKAPMLVTAGSNIAREKAMKELDVAIEQMDALMQDLAGYDRYFRDLIAQIHNSLALLNQSVTRREEIHQELLQQSDQISPRFNQVLVLIQTPSQDISIESRATIINELYYFSGLVEKLQNDVSFYDLDETVLRLEKIGSNIQEHLKGSLDEATPAYSHQQLLNFLEFGTRKGKLFLLKNEQLDLSYQQSFLLQNSQNHIKQLAAQVNLYSDSANSRIGLSLQRAINSINRGIKSIIFLSVFSFLVAGAISWFYVKRNVLQRIIELQHNMRSIASAKLDTKIRMSGNDEVSSMARDLKHFQRTAIAVEQTNKRLAAEIEERKLTEKQLKTTQTELIQAGKLAALGQLSVGITHEINQPLTAIASHLHSAGIRLRKSQTDEVKQSHENIKHLLNKVSVITRHLKSFAREAGSEIVPVNVNKVILDTLELMSNRLTEVNCEMNFKPLNQQLYVYAEPIRLEQVLINLLSNGIDAVKNSQKRQLEIEVHKKENEVLIAVRDNGIGIEPEQLEYLFDPFYTQKDVGEGLGLGLSISYNIVQDFGGQIRVTSEVGKGSSFVLVLRSADKKSKIC